MFHIGRMSTVNLEEESVTPEEVNLTSAPESAGTSLLLVKNMSYYT